MELLIEGELWQPHWREPLQEWQQRGNRWQLLLGKRAERQPWSLAAPWADSPPDGILTASALLASWLEGDGAAVYADPSRQILISASSVLLTLAKESGLLTLGPSGADLRLSADDELADVLQRLLARRLCIPTLHEPSSDPASRLVLRPLRAEDEADIVRYCSDAALARYTLNIPHPYPAESARDWLALSDRKGALGMGWTWALTLDPEDELAPLLGVISLHWNGELAWWVGVPWQNRGLATRAARLVRDFAFEQRHLPALTARHMPANLASGRVMAKLGMHYCGLRPGTDRYPGELSHWRLNRAPRLPDDIRARLAPWLADRRVVVAILHGAWARGEAGGALELALFTNDPRAGEEPLWQDGIELVARRHPLSWLEGDQLARGSHLGGVLLKDRGELGLAYLRRRIREQIGGNERPPV